MASDFAPTGLLPPLVTPFTEDEVVDIGALERLAAEVLDEGAEGVVALATTGEATSLSAAEREAVVSTCAGVCADRNATLIVGAGTNDTRTTIERHEALAEVPGVAASLAVVPYYVRPTEEAIVRHFERVAERSPVPVLVYNIPYRTGRGLGAKSLLELAAIDGIAGCKQAVGGIDGDTLTVLAARPPGFAMLCGDDQFIYPMALMGATGAIAASSHIATRGFADMLGSALAGRLEDGRAHHDKLLLLAQALFAEPSPAVIKAVLHAQGRIPTPNVRMPLANASRAATERALAVTP